MTLITDMALPDEVVAAVGARISKGVEIWGDGEVNISWELAASVVRAALEAVGPMIRNATLEEAAKVAEADASTWHERTGNPCTRIAAACRALATHSGDGEGK